MTRLLPLVILLAGCDLYFTDGDDDDDVCALVDYAYPQVLDPYTGVCTVDYTSQCRPCEPCPATPESALDWAACPGPCDGFAEDACLDAPGCRAAYEKGAFAACWSVAPSGPAPGICDNLDAYGCSRHDNCAAYYEDLGTPTVQFVDCRVEPSSLCDAITCEAGTHCEEKCYPCENPSCQPVCQAYCVPDTAACEALTTEAACTARGDCTPVYLGENCTCDANGNCECEILEYERCQSL
jgi:hypothetical protein